MIDDGPNNACSGPLTVLLRDISSMGTFHIVVVCHGFAYVFWVLSVSPMYIIFGEENSRKDILLWEHLVANPTFEGLG